MGKLVYRYPPSKLYLRRQCPGSAREEEKLPRLETDYMKDGIDKHEEIAKLIRRFLVTGETDTDNHAWDLFVCAENDLDINWDKWYAFVEQKIPLVQLNSNGYIDYLEVHKDCVVVVDWKFGFNESTFDAIEVYGAWAMEEFRKDKAYLMLVYPNLDIVTNSVVIKGHHIWDSAQIVIDECEEEDAGLIPGDHCTYCKALGICEATQKQVTESHLQPSNTPVDEVPRLPAARVAQLLPEAKQVEKIAKAVIARAKQCLEMDPECLPGWELAKRKGRKKIDPQSLPWAKFQIRDLLESSTIHVEKLKEADPDKADLIDSLCTQHEYTYMRKKKHD
jgi:hypothetical protein